MPTRWYRELKKERYYRSAKNEGYRARSAYKLLQINQKYRIIKRGDVVVDLGASPGGWSQVAVKLGARVIAVDIQDMQPIEGVKFIRGDITDEETLEQLKREAKDVDVVISDMSPNLSGNYVMDQARSVWLSRNALNVARILLRENGNFICKVFVGEDYSQFLKDVKEYFRVTKPYSPQASRKRSSEIYVVAKNFIP
ncbi:MAG: RlmE family RNA methyltransferase [Candidatus Thermoplasmatota archaeon]|nr:RlmE family RNA methyltransferase [Candidatus Thermoplasmatota archaeon]